MAGLGINARNFQQILSRLKDIFLENKSRLKDQIRKIHFTSKLVPNSQQKILGLNEKNRDRKKKERRKNILAKRYEDG